MSRPVQDARAPRRHKVPTTWASVLLPGLGHLYAGDRRKAVWLLLIDAALVAGLVVVVVAFRIEAVKLWVSPGALIAILVMNLVVLGLRVGVVVDSQRLAVPTSGTDMASTLKITFASLFLVLPHIALGLVAYTQYDVITTVFAAPEGPVAAAPSTTTTEPEAVAGMSVSVESTTTTLAPEPETPPIWDGLSRLNIVLLGADAGEGRRGLRTDTTIVASIEPDTGDIALFSVPRDLSNAPLPEGTGVWDCDCFPDLITHLYDAAERNPEAFPGSGEPPINAIKAALSEIFGIPIHYYALVTLDGFVGMVDALGGVEIDVPRRIVDETYPHEDGSVESVVIEEGTQQLDGHLALAYARIRRHSDDFSRMHRQRCVLEAVVEQTNPVEILTRFSGVAIAVKEHVSTDIPLENLVDFVDLLPRLDSERIATLRITRDLYKVGGAPGRVYYDIDRIRADAQELMNDPITAQERLGLGSLDATCS